MWEKREQVKGEQMGILNLSTKVFKFTRKQNCSFKSSDYLELLGQVIHIIYVKVNDRGKDSSR